MREASTDELRSVEGGWTVLIGIGRAVLIRLGREGVPPSDKEVNVASLPPEG
jgi:hypothetical protein